MTREEQILFKLILKHSKEDLEILSWILAGISIALLNDIKNEEEAVEAAEKYLKELKLKSTK